MKHSLSLIAVLWMPLTAVHGQLQQGIPENGLVEWYDMDPAAVSNAVAVTAGTVFVNDRFGQPERALEYTATGTCSSCSGVDFVVDSNVVDVFSFAAWLKPGREIGLSGESSQCSGVTMAWNNQNWLLYPLNGGQDFFGVGMSIGTNGISIGEHKGGFLRSRLSYSTGIDDFVHVAVTYGTDSISLFVNGASVASRLVSCPSLPKVLTAQANSSYPGTDSSEGSIVRLGGGLYSPRFSGIIDDYAFWNRPLSAEEVQQLYALPQPILGCTDANACNFDASANLIDDSCEYQGCNDADACNFNGADVCDVDCIYPAVGEDCSGGEGLCGEGTYWNIDEQRCDVLFAGDSDFNVCVNVNDLLDLLSVYGLCLDAEDVQFSCGVSIVEYDGFEYHTVRIGDQCWFVENAHFLPEVSPSEEGSESSEGMPFAYVYGYSGSDVQEAKEFNGVWDTYGALYNYHAAYEWPICPVGWRVPWKEDFTELEEALGTPGAGAYGSDIATQLKDSILWDGVNSSGYTWLAGGYRGSNGNFASLNYSGHYRGFSRADLIAEQGSGLGANTGWTGVGREFTFVERGFSVRCIKGEVLRGCIQPGACNYSSEAELDDGSCYFDGETCDDGDASTYNDVWDSCVCEGTPSVMSDGTGPCLGELHVTYHGVEYDLVEIGEQCWFKENLATTQFRNGDSIPALMFENGIIDNSLWRELTYLGPAVTTPNGSYENLDSLGGLYNQMAVTDTRELCPTDWHVPTELDWLTLQGEIGVSESDLFGIGFIGGNVNAGAALRNESFGGDNSSGFSALPSGYVTAEGSFNQVGERAVIWTSTREGNVGLYRSLYESYPQDLYRQFTRSVDGLSVRCLKNSSVADDMVGQPCNDGAAATYNDTVNEGGICEGVPAISADGPCQQQASVNYHGKEYQLIEVGEQCWFRENLKTMQFANGDTIPNHLGGLYDPSQFNSLSESGPAVSSMHNDLENFDFFGGLYNYQAITDDRNVCPSGWHVSNETDWGVLEMETEMLQAGEDYLGFSGSDVEVGSQLRDRTFGFGENVIGFSALGGGYINSAGQTQQYGYRAVIWSADTLMSSNGSVGGGYRSLYSNYPAAIYRDATDFTDGLSVRCVKDGGASGDPCNDGNSNTYNDVWGSNGPGCQGIEYVALDGSGPCEGEGVLQYQGYDYQLVEIGEFCWFAENLRSLKYQNGDSIPTNLTGAEWASLSTGAVSVYGEGEGRTNFSSDGPDSDNEAYNLGVYGRLYNGYAKNDPRELCPSGWHVSHGSDWDELVSHFGGYEEAGNELKAPDSLFVNWSYQGASGFNALPGGYLDRMQGNFYDRGSRSSFWISSGPYRRNLSSGSSIATNNISYRDGLSIRCVRD